MKIRLKEGKGIAHIKLGAPVLTTVWWTTICGMARPENEWEAAGESDKMCTRCAAKEKAE